MRRFLNLFGWIASAILLAQCAQPGTPGGGPKDTEPPVIIGTTPKNGSPNFEGNKFTIYFDEFIELDEIMQKVMISPPMKKLPDFKVKGKSVQVIFKEELKENTTYSIYFGDAIIDINERNPILNYSYIFSTGPTVDSMSFQGDVINAFNLTPAEDVFVMLYKDENDTIVFDSLPLKVPPFYLSKTDVNGRFQLNGLANTAYLMFAIRDLNGNYFFDQPGEEIAFFDSIITPEFFTQPEIDSVLLDSLDVLSGTDLYDSLLVYIDSLYKDSIIAYESRRDEYSLSLFQEKDTMQRILKAEMLRKNTARFSFSQPMKDITIETINYSNDTTWFIEEYSKERDTLIWYLRDLPVDTLELLFMFRGDTLSYEYLKLDTKKAYPGGERKAKKNAIKKDYLVVKSNIKQGFVKPNSRVELSFDYPIADVWPDSILFVHGEDSIYSPEYSFTDSINRTITIPFTYVETTRYSITLPDSSFFNWNGMFNALTTIKYGTKSPEEYGILKMRMVTPEIQSYILQFMTEKEILLQEFYFENDTSIVIENINPGKYMLKLISDSNGNRKWDTGNYTEKIQPEKVVYYSKQLDVRGNWEIEEQWVIKE